MIKPHQPSHVAEDHCCHSGVQQFWSAEERRQGRIEWGKNAVFLYPEFTECLDLDDPIEVFRSQCAALIGGSFNHNAVFWDTLETHTDLLIDEMEANNHPLLSIFASSGTEKYRRLPLIKVMIHGFRIEICLINFGESTPEGIQFNGTPLHGHPIYGMMDFCFGAQGQVKEQQYELICKEDGKALIQDGKINPHAICNQGYLKKDQIVLHQAAETILQPGDRVTIRKTDNICQPQFDGLIHPHLFTGAPFHSIIIYMGFETRCHLLKDFLKQA